jgi:alpha-tubulin suppressor-like RCC1 family protein
MRYRLIIFSFFFLLCYSCKKEYSCENCVPVPPIPQGPQGPPNPQPPAISTLDCGSGSLLSSAIDGIAYLSQYTMAYTGGNGAAYNSDTIASTGVTGLTATLMPGTLMNGNGNLIYSISGTPGATGYATFTISFTGKNCSLVLTIDPRTIVSNAITKTPIATQKERCLVVLPNGTVKAWGANSFGQIGDGTTINRHTPVQVNMLWNIAAVAAGAYHSLALGNDGKVWTWGDNHHGQLGDGTISESHIPKQVAGLSNVTSIMAGYDYSIALKNDGTVWAWGSNLWGVLGDGTYIDKLQPVQVVNLSGVIAIASGLSHCLALKNDGTVWSWGWNINGCLGDGSNISKRSTALQIPGLSGITTLATNGSIHSLALKNDGTVWVWGDNSHGQLGDGTTLAKFTPIQLTSFTNIESIGTGEYHSFVSRNDGTLWAWGWSALGQLGVDYAFASHQINPVNVTLLSGITRIVGGSWHSLAQKADGTVFAMGGNVVGQLGDGTSVLYRYVPMIVPGLY